MNAGSTAALALVLASLLGAPQALAQDDKAGSEAAQRSMEEAQRKLEEAAREIARLSGETGGLMKHVFKMRMAPEGRAVLGINIDNAAPGSDGVRVVGASPGGPAAEAGVRAGDVIVAIDGKKVTAGREIVERMREVEAGSKVALDILRDGKKVAATVVARAPEDVEWEADFDGPGLHGLPGLPGMPGHAGRPMGEHFLLGPWADAELVTMTPALGRYFGTDKGLLVVRSPKAAAAELEEGDVILSIGGREPQNGGHALRILRSYQPGESVDLKVLRQKKERSVRIVVPEGAVHPARHVIIRKELNKDGADAGPGASGPPVIIRKEVLKPPVPPVPPAPKTAG